MHTMCNTVMQLQDSDMMLTQGSIRPDAHIRGEVLQPFTSKAGSLSEKKIGEFEADLLRVDDDNDKL
jgi:hypothetical protein